MRALCAIIAFTGLLPAADPYPSVDLRNQHLMLTVMTPDSKKGFYRGSRFDWSGVLRDVKFNGHALFGAWKDTHDPKNHDDITGPCEEFRTPLGYSEAKEGETFLKIGVGSLVKPKEEKYSFARNYEIKYPGQWEIIIGADDVTFKQGLLTDDGYGYKYTKTVDLLDNFPGFTITHELTNVGTKTISTDWYNHNFYNINKEAIGVNYSLAFPFNVKAKDAKNDFNKYLLLTGQNVTFNATIDPGSIFAELEGYGSTAEDHAFAIHHNATRVSMLVRGSEPVSQWYLWGIKTTICPEPYVKIQLKPGESKTWTLTYKFSNGRRNGFNW